MLDGGHAHVLPVISINMNWRTGHHHIFSLICSVKISHSHTRTPSHTHTHKHLEIAGPLIIFFHHTPSNFFFNEKKKMR